MNIPSATYRLQFSPEFTFEDAQEIVPYLQELGISHIYASPVFRARRGSTHGYDVTDNRSINPALGGEDAFFALIQSCADRSIGWIQDIVPNHMALCAENPFLVDVMENGSLSRYYKFFDINWEHPYDALRGRIIIPVLGKSFGRCLEDGELQLKFDSAGLYVSYFDHWFPLRMESYAVVFGGGATKLRVELGDENPDLLKFLGVLYTVKNLTEASTTKERYEQIGFVKTLLWEMYNGNVAVREHCDRLIREYNGDNSDHDKWERFEKVLTDQHFRLTFWKTATEELNYRRFFTVNDLIAVRVEDDEVFRTTHRKLLDLVVSGKIDGLRIDHVDGLYNPAAYCARLRTRAPESYIVVEKILSRDEELCRTWPVQGTTGYDFLNMVNQLFCSESGEKSIDRTYTTIVEDNRTYSDLITEKKRLIIGRHMAGDIDNLALQLKELAGKDRGGIDITMYGLRRALVELLTFFPIYRTYVDENEFSETDREVLKSALDKAREAQDEYVAEIDYIERFLGLDNNKSGDPMPVERRKFVMRLQQFTSPLLAKGIEDTALYSYNRLVSLNEVGGHPDVFGIGVEDFHTFCLQRARLWPNTMNATATHDTKRGEGTRARINVLSELGREWAEKIRRWHHLNRNALTKGRTLEEMPVMNDEYLYYQTLVGSFPFEPVESEEYCDRIEEYMIKAVREAKVHSSWIRPNILYENSLRKFVRQTLAREDDNDFMHEFTPFQSMVAWYGMLNSLSQTVLKMTAPGLPDFYQGSELWDFSLVDPDNRRPVDFSGRAQILKEIAGNGHRAGYIKKILDTPQDGRIKLFLIRQLCSLRHKYSDLFAKGTYVPCKVGGEHRRSLIAFLRTLGEQAVLVAVPRMATRLVKEGQMPLGDDIWKNTEVLLPALYREREWENAIVSGEAAVSGFGPLKAGRLFAEFPVAVIVL